MSEDDRQTIVDGKAAEAYGILFLKSHLTREKVPDTVRRQLTDDLPLEGLDIHVGPIDRMTGLIQIVENANEAGNDIPHIVMRSGLHRQMSIHTQSGIRPVLYATAHRKNAVESAHNVVMDRYHEQAAILNNGDLPLEEREVAADKALEIAKNYETHLAEAIAAYDPDAMPEDLPTIIEVYAERLEAVATGQQKAIKAGLTQQAVDNWATCVDQDKALTTIARHCTLGVIEIQGASDTFWRKTAGVWAEITAMASFPDSGDHEGDDPPDAALGADGDIYQQFTGKVQAKAAFKAAAAKIRDVVAVNVPTWRAQLHELDATTDHVHGDKAEKEGTTVIVDCVQVIGVEGRAAMQVLRATYDDNSPAPLKRRVLRRRTAQSTWHTANIALVDGEDKPVNISFRGHNLCGHSLFIVRLTPPATP